MSPRPIDPARKAGAGAHESLLQSAGFVQQRRGLLISCPEEIAYRRGYIDAGQLRGLAQDMSDNAYAAYLRGLLEQPI